MTALDGEGKKTWGPVSAVPSWARATAMVISSSGTLYVMVHGYAASTFTLKTADF